jgi:phosphoglucosamine mutase
LGSLFGTDGVRGTANQYLTPELAFDLGRAATYYFGREEQQPIILIGRDTRISGQMLESALAAGICSGGGKAVLAGVIPTPAIAYLTKHTGAIAGVVISASHNPYPDNGIKFFAGNGYKLSDKVEDELEDIMAHFLATLKRPIAEKVGIIEYQHNLIEQYIEHCLSTTNVSLAGLKIVLDCANGAAYEVAPRILRHLGAEVIVINDQPNGININDNCGSTHLQGLQQAVLKYQADVGLAHDGDADRCLAVDERGEIVDGDHLMVICAKHLKESGHLTDNTLVATVMSNIGLHQALKKNGIKVVVTPVGDRYVLEKMRECSFALGGEQSGHIVFHEYCTTGDGLITALQLLSAMIRMKQPLSVLSAAMTTFPQMLVNVRVASKHGWEHNENITEAIAQGNRQLGETGRILVRPSGTEPLIRVMAEGPSLDKLEAIVREIAVVVKSEQGQG